MNKEQLLRQLEEERQSVARALQYVSSRRDIWKKEEPDKHLDFYAASIEFKWFAAEILQCYNNEIDQISETRKE